MIEREQVRPGFERTRSEDLYPDPIRMSDVREVRTAGERDDLDDAWWVEPEAAPEWGDQIYAEWMAEQGYVQVMWEGYGLVWRHQ